MLPDLAYLRRVSETTGPVELLHEPKFLEAQALFFSVVESLAGTVDFEVADMREVHAVAALGDVAGMRILDIGCGSTEPYVLEDTFRDRYPPFFAEMLGRRGARVTGTDIRPHHRSSHYDHRVLDCTKGDWTVPLHPPYDIVACLSLFNAPESAFEHDETLCERLLDDMRGLVAEDGLLIVTLRDDLFDPDATHEARVARVTSYIATKQLSLLHPDGNCAWLGRM